MRQLKGSENRLNELEERKERKTVKEIEVKRNNILQSMCMNSVQHCIQTYCTQVDRDM
jgi:hypothetical protein